MDQIKTAQFALALLSLTAFITLSPPYVFVLFSLLSLISVIISFIFSEERIKYNLEYLSSLSLFLSVFGVLLNCFIISIFYFSLGLIILMTTIKRNYDQNREIKYLDDLYIIFLSILGFWIIYYRFADLGYIAFLLGINTALLIGFLSHSLMEEETEGEGIPKEVKEKISLKLPSSISCKDLREFFQYTTFFLVIAYIFILFLRDRIEVFEKINLYHFALITIIFALASLVFYARER